MLHSKLTRTLVVGLTLATSVAFAEGTAASTGSTPKLACPAGTLQTGNLKDGLYCRKGDVKAGRGDAHGPYASYFPNGKKSAEGQYVDGFRTGLWTFYSEDGQVRGKTEFQGGNYHGKHVEYFPNGKQRLVEEFANGRRNGLAQEFSVDGKLVRQAQYRDDQQIAEK
ncbi:toxin-antitoxin system YwqK family antitoxin [Archangium violaceum]|uniref:MORN repeat protein n=1 Tax=Archangium violaceum Cb vi76 TaxID=1406225 RepID=A0A084T0X4_9BACT|nr:toxin-antitoxin system YwqK family antitoxin [Archangium violaceum]KFA94359.1 hypothetical protein Q664_03450 [Archangium violaceum Cb vi76]